MPLTGKFNFRRSLTGKIVLQVEEEIARWRPFATERSFRKRWRDATLMDLAAPEMRTLIDLRYRPYGLPQPPSRTLDASGTGPSIGPNESRAPVADPESGARVRASPVNVLRAVPPPDDPAGIEVEVDSRGDRRRDQTS